jgi:prevent-host-death family protein
MKTVKIHNAKTNLSRLIEEVCEGQEIIISRGSQPVARLSGLTTTKGKRKPGSLKGKLQVGAEFFEPLPPAELNEWE